MDSPRRLRALGALVFCALTCVGCASAVHSYVQRGADLRLYRGFDWGQADRTGTGDPRLDNNEIFQERVRAAVETELVSKGFEKASSGAPELLVHYHVSVEQRIDLTETETSEPCPDCEPFIYEAGTLVIDLVDARTNQLLWRGWSDGNIEGVVDNQQWMEDRIDDDVARIFEQLPRIIR